MERTSGASGMHAGIAVLLFALTSGCGGNDASAVKAPPGASKAPGRAGPGDDGRKIWDPARGTAKITGIVRFSGEPPAMREIDMSEDAVCKGRHPEAPKERSVVVNEDGTLRNAFVWVKKGLEGWRFPVPAEPVLINQTGCRYEPHVLGVQTGQLIKVRNSDTVQHNIHALPKRQRGFNFSQPQQGMESQKSFRRPEVLVRLKCDVHGWMGAYVGVVDHPRFVVTGGTGRFELPDLPPGEYTIAVRHEKLGEKTATVTVGDGETREIEFILKAKGKQ